MKKQVIVRAEIKPRHSVFKKKKAFSEIRGNFVAQTHFL
jgi:hypothetical protein